MSLSWLSIGRADHRKKQSVLYMTIWLEQRPYAATTTPVQSVGFEYVNYQTSNPAAAVLCGEDCQEKPYIRASTYLLVVSRVNKDELKRYFFPSAGGLKKNVHKHVEVKPSLVLLQKIKGIAS